MRPIESRARLGCLVGAASLLALCAPSSRAQEPSATAPPPAQSCVDCHQERGTTLKSTPHNALDSEGLAARAGASSACVACHGEQGTKYSFPGAVSENARKAGCQAAFAFSAAEEVPVRAGRCLNCHFKDHPGFRASRHAAAGMECTACHTICSGKSGGHWPLQRGLTQYGSALNTDASTAVCWECHGDVLAQIEQNERHRVSEGIVECTSCHDPHSSSTRLQLGGFKQEQCGNCHTDKTGPFVYEHPAGRVEGCTACHSPHGSPNRHLLAVQSVGELCFSCHAAVPGFHSRFTSETQCTNCHSSIHGSSLDPYFLK